MPRHLQHFPHPLSPDFYKKKNVYLSQIFHKRLTYLIGPEAQEIFFKASDDVLSQNEVYDFMQPVFGKGIVYDASKKNRQVQFQTMANGLRTSRLKAYVKKIEEETRKYFNQFWDKESGEVDLLTALSELTILTASRCLHGEDVRTHIFKEVQELYHDLDHGLTPITVFWPNAPTEAHKKRNAARESMVQLFTKVIEQRREHPERSDGTDILSLFMDIKYKDGTPITMEQVTGLLIALLFAGQHTSCISSTWTSMFIQNEKNFVDSVVEEQKKVLKGDLKKTLEYEDLQEMEFLHNCMREGKFFLKNRIDDEILNRWNSMVSHPPCCNDLLFQRHDSSSHVSYFYHDLASGRKGYPHYGRGQKVRYPKRGLCYG